MSINDVSLFGTLVEDVVPRKNRAGHPFATFHVRTYKFVRDRLTGQPKEHSDVHEVHCYDADSINRLRAHGKAGAWIRIRGEVAYKDNRSMFVSVPTSGGMAIVSTYFGIGITPSHPYRPTAESGATLQEDLSMAGSDRSDRTPSETTIAGSGEDPPETTESTGAASSEVEQPKEPDVATTAALDALHADAGASPPQQEAARVRPTAPPAPARSSLPSLRRPLPAAPAPHTQQASPAPASGSATSPPRPSAPPPPAKPAPSFPGRPSGGMPRPVAPAPASSATASSAPASPSKPTFGRLPASAPQGAQPASNAPKPTGKVLNVAAIPF